MTTTELLTHLRKLNVTLSADNGQLIINGPKAALTAKLRAELSERKAEILKFLHNAAATCAAPRESSLRCISRDKDIPLSFAQQRLWFLDQLEPGSTVYNVPGALRIKGPLDVGVLKQSLEEIVRRHEALRTTFSTVEGEPVQIIAPSIGFVLPAVDISHFSESEREEEAQRLTTEEAKKPFDLGHGPLFRPTLIRLGEDDHVLLLTLHHIVSDAWSMGVLYHELNVLYQAFANAETSPLADLPIQYADFAAWQRGWLQAEVLESQLSYWKKQLEGAPVVLNLRTDRPRPTIQSFRGARQSVELSTELTQGLNILSRKEGVTLYMTLLAAFQALLHRYTGQDDIVVGSPIANRNRIEIEGLIGFFVNTLVLRADHSGNPTFCEMLHRVREMALEAYAHQDLPFEKLVEELRPDRDLSRSPVFQAMFVFQNAPAMELSFKGLNVSPVRVASETAKFDLTLSVNEVAAALRVVLQYNTDLFDASTIERMGGHFHTLLEGIAANPNQRISALPLLTEAEKHQLLVEWNDTERDYPKDKCIHELFETQVEKTPDAIALVFDDQQLTYRALNNRANQLAHYLHKHGVGPEVLVGICVERSIEMVVGILGILKAGGAYVPLDVNYPADRFDFMLADAQVSVLLTQEDSFEDGGSRIDDSDRRYSTFDPGIRRVCPDRDWQLIAMESDANPDNTASADNLAYVIYTSGSTGKPKGVAIEHRNTVAFLSWVHSAFTKEELSGVLASTSICFDLSVFEIFAPLTCGGTIVLAENALALATIPNRSKVSLLNTVPSAINELLRVEAIPSSVRVINLAGEPLRSDLVRRIYESTSVLKVHDLYGPSECTTYSTWTCRTPEGPQTIGRPIANTRIYILDAHRNPVPIGVVGEIYIGGDGVARGYLNRSELTAEKFINHSFDGEPAQRLYRTGDLARYLPDGNIEFLGRIDNQVKIRGYRIELGEIEAVLGQHSAIREAVVTVREDSPADRRLIAYVVSNQQLSPTNNELRSYLREKLPDYMVPAVFVCLDSLPLTPNGKVDRRALPAPAQSRLELDETFSDPRTPTEELLANIWAEVLKLEKVGINDNFFDLGGHSLLATQVMSRLTKAFQVELPLRSLFESPTVAGLAERIEESRRQEKYLPVLPILPMPRTGDMPLSFAQQRLWFLEQLEPNSSVYNVPSGLRLKGPLDIGALEQSLNEIVRRHEALRTTFSAIDVEPVQVISSSLSVSRPVVDLSEQAESEREEEAQRLAKEEARRPFDLARGPLVRATLISLAHDDHVLLLSLHHIVSDGWSMGVLHHELSVLYQAFSNSRPSPLPDLPIQYADYAVWQRKWLKGEELETQLLYWREQLADVTRLQLPTDRPRPAAQSYRGARQSIELSKELTQGLKALSRSHDVTLYMTLLAAFQTLLCRYSGQDDIAVGSPIANRNRTEIESLIGFFVNTLVMRSDLAGNSPFRELLARVREVALGAYAHQDIAFEKLVEEVHPQRNLSYSPLFQVMFVLQNAPAPLREFAGLTLRPFAVETETAKFDLTLTMREEAGGLRGSLQYSTDLFDDVTIERMLGHFQVLLEGIVAKPERRVSELPLLTEAEKHQLLVEWNDTERDFPRDKCIHQLFEEQVAKSPDAIAVNFQDQQLTYGELNRRANQLAHYLKRLGIGPDTLVSICMGRSLEIIIGVLGVLKAGGAYVPLDVNYPADRFDFMLADAQVSVLLTQGDLFEDGESRIDDSDGRSSILDPRIQRVRLDRDWELIARESDANPENITTVDNLAYAIYTSGSTGKPKGVAIEHRNAVAFLSWAHSAFTKEDLSGVLASTSFCFDLSVFEIFAPLTCGGTIVLAENALALATIPNRSKVSLLNTVPSAINELLRLGAIPASVRTINLAGEPLRTDLVRRIYESTSVGKVYDLYGPSECTTYSTWTCRTADGPQTIGRPIANTKIYILDAHCNPVPIGVIGEIYIGGDGVARGYLNRPELTAERFVQHSFDGEPAQRFYRTGDLARYLPDGNIEFLGRIDNQVKIRGYRIELGEIEAVLGQHSAIREAVVTVREDNPGDKRLIAYVVSTQQLSPTNNEVRSYLREKLPEYMVPSVFVFMDSLPLTANGKVDRNGLPMPESVQRSEFVAPRTPVEEKIAEIWAEVLRLDKIGIDDNFFELGGHSLLATQVVSRLRTFFNYDIPLRTLFEAPTVEDLATMIIRQQARQVSETEMERLLEDVEAMSSEDAERCYKEQLKKSE